MRADPREAGTLPPVGHAGESRQHREDAKRVQAPVQRGIFYGWVIVLVSFLTMLLVMGTRFSFGVFYSSMLAEMGWSRAATAGIFSVSMLVYAAVALGVGAAFDWWGPRRMFPVAAVLLGVSFFLCSRMTTLWQFYLYYGIIGGTGFTALGFIPHVALVARWFDRRRGLATSLALAGTGVGAFLLAPWSASLIAHYGWRQSYLIYAVIIPGVLIPLILLGIAAVRKIWGCTRMVRPGHCQWDSRRPASQRPWPLHRTLQRSPRGASGPCLG